MPRRMREYGRQDSNLHGRLGAGGLAKVWCPVTPKVTVYANSTTPASNSELDVHGTIDDNEVAYRAVCKQGPGGESASKTNPLRGLGLGGLPRLRLSHRGTSHPLPALRLTASNAATASCPGRYIRPPCASRLEWSYTLSRLNPSGFRTSSTSNNLRPIPRGSHLSACEITERHLGVVLRAPIAGIDGHGLAVSLSQLLQGLDEVGGRHAPAPAAAGQLGAREIC